MPVSLKISCQSIYDVLLVVCLTLTLVVMCFAVGLSHFAPHFLEYGKLLPQSETVVISQQNDKK